MYSFSTCWNSARHTDGRAMLAEIRELGFEYAELSHGIRVALLPGILQAVDAGEIKISSLHNFCPLPLGVNHASPNLYQFSADAASDRELALKYTIKTIEFAVRVRSPIVVMHLGHIDIKDYTGKLGNLVKDGGKDSPAFRKLSAEAAARLDSKKKPYVDRVYESLKRILPEAEKRGVKLGLENRQALEEIPLDKDFASFLQDFNSPNVCYWHDCGHAQIKENLGFIQHQKHLETLAPRLAGFHVHDVKFPAKDHVSPGSGMIDFAALKPVVRPEHIKVFEFDPEMPVESARRGIEHVRTIWGAE